MKSIKSTCFGLALVWVSLIGASAQNTSLKTGGAAANEVLLKATGPYEDIVHYLLARNDEKVAKSLAAADANASEVVTTLAGADAREFEGLRQKIHESIGRKDRTMAAGHSAEVFRMLVDHLEAGTLVVPKEVELLDYAGYKLSLMASFGSPDWKGISKLVNDSDAWWTATAAKVSDKHLRATMTSAIKGLKQASEQKNGSTLQLGAQMVLDLVDMLEDAFNKANVTPALK